MAMLGHNKYLIEYKLMLVSIFYKEKKIEKDVKCGCTITVGMNDEILSCGKHSYRCRELTDLEVDVYRFKERVKYM